VNATLVKFFPNSNIAKRFFAQAFIVRKKHDVAKARKRSKPERAALNAATRWAET